MAIQNDGFSTTIGFPSAGIEFLEKEVTAPSIDGGGPNDTTTMRNIAMRTRQPKRLITMDKVVTKVAWDPSFYTTIISALINVNQEITIIFPEGDIMTFWGWLNKFTPDANKEGEQPTAELEIICSNQDNAGVETAPVMS